MGSIYFEGSFSVQVVGDDLLMSNPKRIEKAAKESACNALLLKVNIYEVPIFIGKTI